MIRDRALAAVHQYSLLVQAMSMPDANYVPASSNELGYLVGWRQFALASSSQAERDKLTRIGEDFVQWRPPAGDDTTLGVVDFSIYPHLARDGMPGNSMAGAERWAAGLPNPAYAMDDETAIKVVDGTVEVVSEGDWRLFTPTPEAGIARAWNG